MENPETQYEVAIDLANDALAEFRNDPTPAKFRIWRDASEVAIKWCRAVRLNASEGSGDGDDELAALLRR